MRLLKDSFTLYLEQFLIVEINQRFTKRVSLIMSIHMGHPFLIIDVLSSTFHYKYVYLRVVT